MTISGERTKQLDIIAGFLPCHWLYEWFSQFHSSILSRIHSNAPFLHFFSITVGVLQHLFPFLQPLFCRYSSPATPASISRESPQCFHPRRKSSGVHGLPLSPSLCNCPLCNIQLIRQQLYIVPCTLFATKRERRHSCCLNSFRPNRALAVTAASVACFWSMYELCVVC